MLNKALKRVKSLPQKQRSCFGWSLKEGKSWLLQRGGTEHVLVIGILPIFFSSSWNPEAQLLGQHHGGELITQLSLFAPLLFLESYFNTQLPWCPVLGRFHTVCLFSPCLSRLLWKPRKTLLYRMEWICSLELRQINMWGYLYLNDCLYSSFVAWDFKIS